MGKKEVATKALVEAIDDYDDPVGDIHPAVKREYQAKAVNGDLDARWVLVTGTLDVKGRLSNFEGCLIAVGGDVRASGGLLTEGPLWVDGDTDVKPGIVARHDDYRAHFRGHVKTPVLVEDNHIVEAGKTIAGKTFSKIGSVPAPVRAKLAPLGIRWAE